MRATQSARQEGDLDLLLLPDDDSVSEVVAEAVTERRARKLDNATWNACSPVAGLAN